MDKKKLVEILFKNFNYKGLIFDALDEALEPALKKVVEDSSNPFDDMLMASVYPILEKELKEYIEKNLDLKEIILGKDEESAE